VPHPNLDIFLLLYTIQLTCLHTCVELGEDRLEKKTCVVSYPFCCC